MMDRRSSSLPARCNCDPDADFCRDFYLLPAWRQLWPCPVHGVQRASDDRPVMLNGVELAPPASAG